jgi:hypothetical protein
VPLARAERMKVEGVQKQMSQADIEMYTLTLWLQAKRGIAERRRREAKAAAKRQRIARLREGRS